MNRSWPYDDAVACAQLVRDGTRTALELVDEAICRIEALNPNLNAVIYTRFDQARHEARSPARGPFSGVPLLIKDAVCYTAGDPYHAGMKLLRDHHWTEDEDSYLAARFRKAGFVFLGKTNVPELATAFTTEPVAYGPTRNPWDERRSAGGSSGGSAAAVASGMVAVAHGNDMGGSIRVPASECGVVGIKPSRGRTSLGPRFGHYWAMLAQEGILTRSVRDAAAVLDAIAGPETGDPCIAPSPSRPYSAELCAGEERLRVAYRIKVPGGLGEPDDVCANAVVAVARCLSNLGHQVMPTSATALDDGGMPAAFEDVFGVCVARDLDRWGSRLGMTIRKNDIEPRNWTLAEHGRNVSGPRYVASIEYLEAYARRVANTWEREGFDLMLTPTMRSPPPLLGTLPANPTIAEVADLGQFTAPFNVTGQPAISLPVCMTAGVMPVSPQLPVGVQLVAPYGREDLLFRVAAQIERALPWRDRCPPSVHEVLLGRARKVSAVGSARPTTFDGSGAHL